MSESSPGPAAPMSPLARMVGVIASPGKTFEEIVRKPGWIPPFLCFLVMIVIAMSIWGMKADFVTIIGDQIENSPFLKLAPEGQRDQIVSKGLEPFRKQTQAQTAMQTVISAGVNQIPFFHGMALVYATLFVLMGALKDLKLGSAWINFLLCLVVYLGYLGVYVLSTVAFSEATNSAILLCGTASVAMLGGWMWLLNRRTTADPEFHRIMAVCCYSSAVLIVWTLVFTAICLATPAPIQTYIDKMVRSNLGALVSTGVPVLQKLLEALDLFTIWWLTTLTLGFRSATRLSIGMTASITFLPWAIVVMIKLAWTAVFG